MQRALFAPRRGPGAAVQALGRLKPGTLNKTEEAYAAYLAFRQQAGEVLWFRFEPMKLRLAANTSYAPDFLVMLGTGLLEMHEVKGFWQDDARVKIKVAAEAFPIFRFVAVKMLPKKDGGGWAEEEF